LFVSNIFFASNAQVQLFVERQFLSFQPDLLEARKLGTLGLLKRLIESAKIGGWLWAFELTGIAGLGIV